MFYPRYQKAVIRPAAILTNSYVAANIIGATTESALQPAVVWKVDDCSHLGLEIVFTLGSLTSLNLKIEFSDDNGTTWYQLSNSTTSGGVITPALANLNLTASANMYLNINSIFFNGGGFKTNQIRVSAQGVGTVTSSSLQITAVVGTI